MRWKTDEIMALLQGIGEGPQTGGTGGDYDTTCIFIPVDGDHIFITGFAPDAEKGLTDEQRDDVEIAAVELRNCDSDSSGGIQSKSKLVRRAYYECHDRLSEKGFAIIGHYDEIF